MTVKCCELESRQKHLRQAKIKDVAQNYEEKKNFFNGYHDLCVPKIEKSIRPGNKISRIFRANYSLVGK